MMKILLVKNLQPARSTLKCYRTFGMEIISHSPKNFVARIVKLNEIIRINIHFDIDLHMLMHTHCVFITKFSVEQFIQL